MKHTLLTIILASGISLAYAQEEKGAAQIESMRTELKSELKLTDAQVDSVKAIQQDFRTAAKPILSNRSLSKDEQKQQLIPLRSERDRRLRANFSREQVAKIHDMMREQREQRREEHPRTRK